MFKYFLTIASIVLSAGMVHAQSGSAQKTVSLEDWDVGAVKVITAPKPESASKNKTGNKAGNEKNAAGGTKTGGGDQKAIAKTQDKATDKNTSAQSAATVASVIDFTTSSTSSDSVSESKVKSVLTGRPDLDGIINSASKESGVDANLIYSVMHQESGFHQNAVSPKGASGLMQLIPSTARRFGVQDIFDPKQNVHAGAKYLRFLLDTFDGDVELALAGYNAGENAVIKYGYRVPPYSETQNYVRNIVSRYGQKTLRPSNITAGMRLATPIIVATSEKGVLLLSNNY